MKTPKAMGLPFVPDPNLPIRPDQFRCECVCVEVQKVLDARKQIDCDVFFRLVQFAAESPSIPLINVDRTPFTTVDWQPTDDIICLNAVFAENGKEQIFVIEKPPVDFEVMPLGGIPPAAEIITRVTPGTNNCPIWNPDLDCRVRDTVLVQLQNNTAGRTPSTGWLEICPVGFMKDLVLFFPDQELVGQVSVKTESHWEILACDVDVCLSVLRASVTVGAQIIVKSWADVQLVTTAFGECDWELIPPPFAENPCLEFVNRPFPPFNPPQLQDYYEPPCEIPPVPDVCKKPPRRR